MSDADNAPDSGAQGDVEILPPQEPAPTDEDVVESARIRSQSRRDSIWGLDDDDCAKVIAAELILFQRRQHQLVDWFAIGEAIELLQQEVINESGTSNHMGRRYNPCLAADGTRASK